MPLPGEVQNYEALDEAARAVIDKGSFSTLYEEKEGKFLLRKPASPSVDNPAPAEGDAPAEPGDSKTWAQMLVDLAKSVLPEKKPAAPEPEPGGDGPKPGDKKETAEDRLNKILDERLGGLTKGMAKREVNTALAGIKGLTALGREIVTTQAQALEADYENGVVGLKVEGVFVPLQKYIAKVCERTDIFESKGDSAKGDSVDKKTFAGATRLKLIENQKLYAQAKDAYGEGFDQWFKALPMR